MALEELQKSSGYSYSSFLQIAQLSFTCIKLSPNELLAMLKHLGTTKKLLLDNFNVSGASSLCVQLSSSLSIQGSPGPYSYLHNPPNSPKSYRWTEKKLNNEHDKMQVQLGRGEDLKAHDEFQGPSQ